MKKCLYGLSWCRGIDGPPHAQCDRCTQDARFQGQSAKALDLAPVFSTVAEKGLIQDNPLTEDSKPSNPKDSAATDRIGPVVPLVATLEEALAFFEGALKYGWHNYTVVGVRASVYVFAACRHIFKFYCGQDRDPVSRVHHLGNARACLAVLLDAQHRGKLVDDRPPALPDMDALFDRTAEVMRHLTALYGDRKPRNYTIADSER